MAIVVIERGTAMRTMPTLELEIELHTLTTQMYRHGLTDAAMTRYRTLTTIADNYRTANGGWEGQ